MLIQGYLRGKLLIGSSDTCKEPGIWVFSSRPSYRIESFLTGMWMLEDPLPYVCLTVSSKTREQTTVALESMKSIALFALTQDETWFQETIIWYEEFHTTKRIMHIDQKYDFVTDYLLLGTVKIDKIFNHDILTDVFTMWDYYMFKKKVIISYLSFCPGLWTARCRQFDKYLSIISK